MEPKANPYRPEQSISPEDNEKKDFSEKYGRDVKIDIICHRHAKKTSGTTSEEMSVTLEGLSDAQKFGRAIEVLRDGVKAYHSGIQRSGDTTREIMAAISEEHPETKIFKTEVKYDLGTQLRKEVKGFILSFGSMSIYDEIYDKKGPAEAMDWLLSFKDQKPDEKSLSPYEIAAREAKVLRIFTKMAEKVYSGSAITILLGSHSLVMEPFLQRVFGFEKIDEIGGPVKYLENFKIEARTDSEGRKTMDIKFRNLERTITQEELDEITNYRHPGEKNGNFSQLKNLSKL